MTQPWASLVAIGENTIETRSWNTDQSTLREVRARAKRGELPRHEADFGDFSAGRFGFVLRDVRRILEPIPARGMLGLWELPRAIEAAALRSFVSS